MIIVFNKVDLCSSDELARLEMRYRDACFVSSVTGYGIDALCEQIASKATALDEAIDVLIRSKKVRSAR